MIKVFILKGLPGSGKSTWARELMDEHPSAYKRVNKDDLRAMLDNGKWSPKNEKMVLELRDHIILQSISAGKHVIVDDTNLHTKHEEHINAIVKKWFSRTVKVEVEDFTDVPLKTCIERDLKRPNSVGEQVIKKMYANFLAPKQEEVERDANLPDCIICDIDGTLAIMGDRSPYDASKCEVDAPRRSVIDIVRTYEANGVPVILFSGREEKDREPTQAWLLKNRVLYHNLHMRPTDDGRKDCIIKDEMYREHIKGKYNVLFVLDDRQQVVDMWRELGLTCLQVAPGDF